MDESTARQAGNIAISGGVDRKADYGWIPYYLDKEEPENSNTELLRESPGTPQREPLQKIQGDRVKEIDGIAAEQREPGPPEAHRRITRRCVETDQWQVTVFEPAN